MHSERLKHPDVISCERADTPIDVRYQTADDERTSSFETPVRISIDTLIISDLHLGSKVARAKRVMAVLQRHMFKRLILNGDVFDDLNFRRMNADDWKVLSCIRKLSNPKHGIEVVWVIGNHDGGVAEVLSHLLGIPVHEEYVFNIAGKRHLAIHGHQFDRWISDRVVITAVATALYTILQILDPNYRFSRWIKRTSKRWLRMGDVVANAATNHGRNGHAADVVHCGHTHLPTAQVVNGVLYVNSGCWTDTPSNFVRITHDGDVQLCSDADLEWTDQRSEGMHLR